MGFIIKIERRCDMDSKLLTVGAHRGAMCYAPENTIAAFAIAIEQDCYRIEFDVRRTVDGQLVVMHDDAVDRTTDGSGLVSEMNLSELKKLRSGMESVPTLKESLDFMAGKTRMLIEQKEIGLTEQIIREVRSAGVENDCTLVSLHEEALIEARQINSKIDRGFFIIRPGIYNIEEICERVDPKLFIVWPAAVQREYIEKAVVKGITVRCGFKDDQTIEQLREHFQILVEMGVTEFSCGRPDWIKQLIREYNSMNFK